MRILDIDREASAYRLGLFLSTGEAQDLKKALEDLLANPEASKHRHLFDEHDVSREIILSIVTEKKLEAFHRYTKLEQDILKEK